MRVLKAEGRHISKSSQGLARLATVSIEEFYDIVCWETQKQFVQVLV